MKRFLYLVFVPAMLLICGWNNFREAAEGDLLWDQAYGGSNWDEARCVVQTPDGGYALAGMTQSYGAGLQDFFLVKTDASGDTLWTRTYGGPSYEHAYSLIVTNDDGLLLVGQTQSFGAGSLDFWVVKTDAAGDTQWTRTYGADGDDYGQSVVQTEDNGFALVGSTFIGSGDILLVRTDANGDEIWSRSYGGFFDERGYSIAQTTDGGFLLVGETSSFGAGNRDAWMLKVDADGDSLWSQTFGDVESDYGYWGAETGGGYVLAGITEPAGTGSVDALLAKANLQGDSLWAFAFGGNEATHAYAATQTADAFLLTGVGVSFYQPAQVLLIKTELNGNELWTESYGDSLPDDFGFSIIQNSDGDYIIAGRSSTPSGDYEAYLLAVEGSATGVEPGHATAPKDFALYPAHPNPFNASTAISYKLQAASNVELRLYDVNGNLVDTLVNGWRSAGRHELTFDAKHLASGVYLAMLTAGDLTLTQKLVLMK